MALPKGTRLGAYELLEEIGRGGAGAVFAAKGPGGARVAVKVLLSSSPQKLARFERERRLLASFGEAEGFVPFVDAGSSPSGPYIVMGLVEGGTLTKRIAKKPLGIAETRELGIALARALAKAHERGVIHRDLKPGNILFTKDGKPLVADLGVAKHFDRSAEGASQSAALSATGTAIGTFGYMAPEQLKDAKGAGPPADVFSLGAILYECLSGSCPFHGESVVEIFEKITKGVYLPVRRTRPDAPADLAAAIERALSVEPASRFADGGAFARALEAGASRRTVPLLALLAGAVAIAAVGGVLLATRGGPAPAPPPAALHPFPPRPPATPPPPPPKAERVFPAACKSFLKSEHARLTGFAGDYAWHHAQPVEVLAWSPDAKVVYSAAGAAEHCLRAWSASDGAELWSCPFDAEPVALSASTEGRLLALGLSSGALLFVDARTGERLRKLEGPPGETGAFVAFVPRSERVVIARGNAVSCMDGATFTELWTGTTAADVVAMTMGFDKELVSISERTGGVSAWDVRVGRRMGAVPGAGGGAVAFSADGRKFASAGRDGSITIRNTDRFEALGDPLPPARSDGSASALALAFVPGSDLLVVSALSGDVTVWDLAKRQQVPADLGGSGRTNALAVSRDGRRLATGADDRIVRVFDLPAGGGAPKLSMAPGDPFAPALAPLGDGKVVAGGWDGALHVLDVESGKLRRSIPLGHGSVHAIVANKDRTRVYCGMEDGQVLSWTAATDAVGGLMRMPIAISALALARDESRVGVGAADGAVVAIPTTRDIPPERPVTPHGRTRIDAVSFSADGKWLLSVAENGTVAVTGRKATRFVPQPSHLAHGECAPSGARALVLAHPDQWLLWDLEGHRSASQTLPCARDANRCAWLDARRAAVSGFDGTIRIVDVDAAKEIGRIDLGSSHDLATDLVVAGSDLYVLTARSVVLRFALALPGP